MQVYVGGIVPMSTVDWPKNVCTVVFFAGCDFKCPYCQNSSLIEFKERFLTDTRTVKTEIRKSLDFVDAILFSGGEPCLQRSALLELATFVRRIDKKLGLETNGTKPDVVRALLKDGLDFLAMDLKAPLADVALFERATASKTFFKTTEEVIVNVRETLAMLRTSRAEIEIRTTLVPGLIYRKEDLLKIADELEGLDCRWALQQFRSDVGEVLDSRYATLKSPSKAFLENLRDFLQKERPSLRIDVKAV